ncbi:MAG: hypothetical protein WCG85_18850 [Polyangia bacterium]
MAYFPKLHPMPTASLSHDTKQVQLSRQIRDLKREIADIDQKRAGLGAARIMRMNKLARLEAQAAICADLGSARSMAT